MRSKVTIDDKKCKAVLFFLPRLPAHAWTNEQAGVSEVNGSKIDSLSEALDTGLPERGPFLYCLKNEPKNGRDTKRHIIVREKIDLP
ncbi:LOW QUALITY PROTEIN: hypothetical protein IFM46972_02159 [Aspergillus udagawae]|uniref:Uncharacterized protein n=1 Tax=Aspergillus udagawae TaxID=91492 RepID=A0A8H3NBC8_9EURO|nr:LOW QUALITY PROTEIN: hypothetical protein IFM46972_02159 [Aspergillus udagawae]